MRRTKRVQSKILAVLLVVMLLIANTTLSSAEDSGTEEPTIVVSDATVVAGDVATVTVGLENNPGIVSMTLRMTYDTDVLTLSKVTDAGVLGTQSHKPELQSPYTLVWVNDTATTNYTVTGTIATLEFQVAEDVAVGTVVPIEITYDYNNYDIYDKDANRIQFVVDNGSVTVGEPKDEEFSPNAIGDFIYTASGNEITITGYTGSATEVVIGSTYIIDGVEYTVVEIGMEAFLENETITKVTIPESVKKIGEAAFYDCTSLTEVIVLSKDVEIEDVALGYYYASRKEQIVDGFTIYGYEGSTAEDYAASSDEITFVAIQEEEPNEEDKTIGSGTLRVFGAGFKVNNGVTQTIYNYTQAFAIGESITLTATGDNFAYWMNESNKIVTTEKEHTFTMAGDVMFTAVYKNTDENTAYVEFVSDYGQVMQAQNYTSSSEIQIPGAVNKVGYKFISWSMTASDIAKKISEGDTYIRVTPVYEALLDTFIVTTIYDGDTENAEVVEGYAGYQFKEVTAKTIEGRTFSHWSDSEIGETILSTSESYSIYINKNTTIYAIYVDEGTEVTKVSTMVTNDISAKLLDSTTKSLVVLATRDIIDGYTLVEHGILYSANSAYGQEGAEDTMIIGASGVSKGISTATASSGAYAHTITLTDEQLDVVVYARGYMILADGEGNQTIIYGAILNGSYNILNQ